MTSYNIEAAEYTIPAVRQGDTWRGMTMDFDIDLTDCRARMWVIPAGNNKAVKKYDTEDATITVTDAAEGVITWPSELIDFAPGVYNYEIEITHADGRVATYIIGTWTILKQYTS